MADTSRLMDVLAQLAPKVDELVSYKQNTPPAGDDGGHTQSQIDAAADAAQAILARIP